MNVLTEMYYDDLERPEVWLKETGLMEIISSEEYQTQLAHYFDKQLSWGTLVRKIGWSDAFEGTLKWLTDILKDPTLANVNPEVAEWRNKIMDAITPLNRRGQACAKFWITKYSLLKSLPRHEIEIPQICHCYELLQAQKKANHSKNMFYSMLARLLDNLYKRNNAQTQRGNNPIQKLDNELEDILNEDLTQVINDVINQSRGTEIPPALKPILNHQQKFKVIEALKN
jgi:hypothetical protein